MKPQDVTSCDNIAVYLLPNLTTHFPTSHVNISILAFWNFSKIFVHIITLFSWMLPEDLTCKNLY